MSITITREHGDDDEETIGEYFGTGMVPRKGDEVTVFLFDGGYSRWRVERVDWALHEPGKHTTAHIDAHVYVTPWEEPDLWPDLWLDLVRAALSERRAAREEVERIAATHSHEQRGDGGSGEATLAANRRWTEAEKAITELTERIAPRPTQETPG